MNNKESRCPVTSEGINILFFCYIYKKRLSVLLNNMATHVNNCPLETNLKHMKMEKINKIYKNLNMLNKHNLIVQKAGLILLKLQWRSIVKENGYISIDQTLKHLNIVPCLDSNLSLNNDKNSFSMVNGKEFISSFKDIILPINCQIRYINNKKSLIDCCRVRPSLPCIEGRLHGLCVNIDQPTFTLKIFGIITSDPIRYYRNKINKTIIIDDIQTRYAIPKSEIEPYLNTISLRDYMVYEYRQISNKVKQNRDKIAYYKNTDTDTMSVIYAEYQFLLDNEKIEFINLLLELDLTEQVRLLLQLNGTSSSGSKLDMKYIDWESQKKMSPLKEQRINIVDPLSGTIFTSCLADERINRSKNVKVDKDAPYEIKIASMKVADKVKTKAYDKLKIISKSQDGAPKEQKYLDGLLRIPFGQIKNESELSDNSKVLINDFISKYSKYEGDTTGINLLDKVISTSQTPQDEIDMAISIKRQIQSQREKQQSYLKKVQEILESCVHGHKLVKTQINRLLAKWISGGQSGMVIGLQGPPGNGKTTLIKQGLAKCLVDQHGNSRPVGFIPLGGTTGSSSLVGHSYTYQGSNWGRIVDILIDSECMNPIFLFDELDKVSKTDHGNEIIGILTHLTDSSQNSEFYDKYFDGVPLDLSKSLMVFTFNDISVIDPILLDRMVVIKTEPLTIDDKKIVTRKHLIPQIVSGIDLEPESIIIEDELIEDIIVDYTREAGARQLKRILEDLIQELNLRRLLDPGLGAELKIDEDLICNVLHHLDKIRRESITDSESTIIGQINGMYANVLALGGILPIQVCSSSGSDKLELTGMQGDVMKESMKCAKTMAYSMLSMSGADETAIEELSKIGLHIHCPSTSMPKDGPSAGGAICLAIYSYISKRPILQNVAMTGEIDLIGRITAIGGLEAKLHGAKKAGINTALIPKENKEQLTRLRDDGKSPEDYDFRVIEIGHISEALPYVFDD